MKLGKVVIIGAYAVLSGFSDASVTIIFNSYFVGGVSSNFADAEGRVRNGMHYGIVVDGTGNGFRSTYDFIVPSQGGVQVMMAMGVPTDDVIIFADDLTADNSLGGILVEGDGITSGGDGGLTGIRFFFLGGAEAGDPYALIWFDPEIGSFGTLQSPVFVVPPDGHVVHHDQPFLGVDPIRPATSGVLTVPEPRAATIAAIGILIGLRRRR